MLRCVRGRRPCRSKMCSESVDLSLQAIGIALERGLDCDVRQGGGVHVRDVAHNGVRRVPCQYLNTRDSNAGGGEVLRTSSSEGVPAPSRCAGGFFARKTEDVCRAQATRSALATGSLQIVGKRR